MSNPKEIVRETERIEEMVREQLEKVEKLENRKKKKIERIEREIEDIATQILNKRCFKKLAKNGNIELRNNYEEFIINAIATISNGKKVEPINSTLKNEIVSYCDELPFGIISFKGYLNIETMNIIPYYDENEIGLFEDASEKFYEETPKY